jgi:hypothetical protein
MNITYEDAQAMLRFIGENCESDEDVALALKGFEKLTQIKPIETDKIVMPTETYDFTCSECGKYPSGCPSCI